MAKPDIFVPYDIRGKKEYPLYTIESIEVPYAGKSWIFYEENRNDNIITDKANAKLWKLQDYCNEHGKGREFELLLRGKKQPDAKIHDGTLSVFLSLYLTVKQQIGNLPFNAGWASVTVTGDIEIRDGHLVLEPVDDIKEKYEGFKKEIKEYTYSAKDRHLFLYVGDALEDKEQNSHIYIKACSPQDTIESVINWVFGPPSRNELQDSLYTYMTTHRPKKIKNIEYIRTGGYRQMESEMFSPNWHGFFIQGEGESGKSALAEALAEHLFKQNEVHAPLWIFVKNEEIPKPQDENVSQKRTIQDYLTDLINERLDDAGKKDLTQVLSEKKYVLIIDNLEFDNVTAVLEAIQDIIKSVTENRPENKPYLIITSRVGVNSRSILQELSIDPPKNVPELDIEGIKEFVAEINKSNKNLKDLNEKQGYAEFIQTLYDNFRFSPGLMIVAVSPLQEGISMLELLPNLRSMHGDNIETKASKIYSTVFSMLDEFTQIVLFVLINIISPDTLATKNELVKAVKATGRAGSSLLVEEKIVKALKTLENKFIIYHEEENGTSRYGMKGVAFLAFMFGDIFDEKPDALEGTGKNPREILAKTHILRMALRYDRLKIIDELDKTITDPLEKGKIFYEEAMIQRPGEYIGESIKYYEQAWKSAEPGSERYIKTARGYLQALNSASMIHESWDQLNFFLDELSKMNLEDLELQVQIGDAYYKKGYYIERIGEHFELADTAYRKALKLCSRETETERKLYRTISIKQALNLSTWSDAAKNQMDLLDQAESILKDVEIFAGCTRENFPALYADREMALGDIYDRCFLLSRQREDIDKAITSYTHARDTYSKKENPIKYSEACRAMSLVYLNASGLSASRAEATTRRSSASEEWNQAMQTCKDALVVFTKNDFPVYYAATQNHLGNIYKASVASIAEPSVDYFEEARKSLEEAQEIYQRKKYDFWYGRVKHNMADLYRQHAEKKSLCEKDKITYLRKAIENFDGSIEYRKKYPKYYGDTLLQMGRACNALAKIPTIEETEKRNVLNKAIQTFDEGLTIPLDDEKVKKGRLYWNKGLALEGLFLLTKRKDYINDAIEQVKGSIKYIPDKSDDRPKMEKDLQRMEGYNL
jgi:hypothetical protein